jgi:hypothetical protein
MSNNKNDMALIAIPALIALAYKFYGESDKGGSEKSAIEASTIQFKEKIDTPPSSNNFKFSEFACNDQKKTPVPKEYWKYVEVWQTILEKIRSEAGNKPIKINSAYRTHLHNIAVGGALNSYHLKAMAVDIKISGMDILQQHIFLSQLIAKSVIPIRRIIYYDTFTHLDFGAKPMYLNSVKSPSLKAQIANFIKSLI